MNTAIRLSFAAFLALGTAGIGVPTIAGEPVQREATKPAAVAEPAPDFVGISKWFNSSPLTLADLRGKVVLVDFWTYGCYNCVNTLCPISPGSTPPTRTRDW